MYFIRSPYVLKRLSPRSLTWEMPNHEKMIYLTFDDGPSAKTTIPLLKILDEFNVKATFFCVGEMVSNYPDAYKEVLIKGHMVGNHTYNHLNGWKTKTCDFIKNVHRCRDFVDSKLFRPPYGKIKLNQVLQLKKDFSIIMWTVLSADFDRKISKEQCLENVIKHTKSGSIVVFHDSKKAMEKVMYALPKFLEHFLNSGYKFNILK